MITSIAFLPSDQSENQLRHVTPIPKRRPCKGAARSLGLFRRQPHQTHQNSRRLAVTHISHSRSSTKRRNLPSGRDSSQSKLWTLRVRVNDDKLYDAQDHDTNFSSRLVFRVKLEFLVQGYGPGAKGRHLRDSEVDKWKEGGEPDDDALVSIICRDVAGLFRHAGLDAATEADDEGEVDPASEQSWSNWKQWQATHPDRSDGESYEKGVWQVSRCWNAVVDEEIQFLGDYWAGLSILSPLMLASTKWADKIQGVCDIIRNNYNIGLNETPRLMVDVKHANGDFALDEVKKLAKLLWVADPWINELHAPHCQPGSPFVPGLFYTKAFYPFAIDMTLDELAWTEVSAPSVFDRGFAHRRTTAMLDPQHLPGGQTGSIGRSRMLKIDEQVTLSELVEMLSIVPARKTIPQSDGDYSTTQLHGAYRFGDLLDEDDPDNRAVRFAQHAGTLDRDAIENWVMTCLVLVDLCHDAKNTEYAQLLGKLGFTTGSLIWEDGRPVLVYPPIQEPGDYSIYELLQHLGYPSTASYYQARGRNPNSPELASLARKPALELERIKAESKKSPRYTFGVEMELLVPCGSRETPNHPDSDPDPADKRWFCNFGEQAPTMHDDTRTDIISAKLRDILSGAGLLAMEDRYTEAVSSDFMRHRYEHSRAHSGGFLLDPEIKPCYQAWHIQDDLSLTSTEKAIPNPAYAGGITGIELSTPILAFDPDGTRKLVDTVALLRSQVRFYIDPGCGLHVHIASAGESWTLETVKRIASLVWFAEPAICGLVAPYRVASNYARPMHTHSRIAWDWHKLPAYDGPNESLDAHIPIHDLEDPEQRAMASLWQSSDLYELEKRMAKYDTGRCGLSTGSLSHKVDPASNSSSRSKQRLVGTFEFRYLQSTMDTELMVQWTHLCVALVRKAETAKTDELHRLISNLVRCRTKTSAGKRLKELLKGLGLEERFGFWLKYTTTKTLARPDAFDDLRDRYGHHQADFGKYFAKYGQAILPVSDLEAQAVNALLSNMSF